MDLQVNLKDHVSEGVRGFREKSKKERSWEVVEVVRILRVDYRCKGKR